MRKRTGDIALLTDYYTARYAAEMGIENLRITEEAKTLLAQHTWPGNVRELANTIQKAVIFNRGAPIGIKEISQAIGADTAAEKSPPGEWDQVLRDWIRREILANPQDNLFDVNVDRFASILVSETLNLTGGNRSQAAKMLGLSRPTLHSKIEKYRLKMETSVTEANDTS